MPNPVCCKCDRFMIPTKNAVAIVELKPMLNYEVKAFEAYKLWQGDRWGCPKCGGEVVVGFGTQPISEHYKDDFKQMLSVFKPERQVM